jgi:hypothetical protein
MVLWKDPVPCRPHTSQHRIVSKTNTREVAETTTVRVEWRVSRKTRVVRNLVVTRTVGEAKSRDESDQQIGRIVGLRSAQKASVSVEVGKSGVATEKAADETAKEKVNPDLGGNHVKTAGATAAPATTGELQEGMSAIGGAEEVAREVEETTAARGGVIPRTKHTVIRRGDGRISRRQNRVVEYGMPK